MWGVLFADATIAGAQTGEGASKQHTREARHPVASIQESTEKVIANVERVIVGKHQEVRLALVALLAMGQLAVAQDATPDAGSPTAAQMEGDALVRSLDPTAPPDGWTIPAKVGHVTNYLVHEWYQNLTKGEQARADDWGIEFSINDANLDLTKSLAAVDDYLAQGVDVLKDSAGNLLFQEFRPEPDQPL